MERADAEDILQLAAAALRRVAKDLAVGEADHLQRELRAVHGRVHVGARVVDERLRGLTKIEDAGRAGPEGDGQSRIAGDVFRGERIARDDGWR